MHEGQTVIIANPVGKGAQQFKGLRAKVLSVKPRIIGSGEVVHVAFLEGQFPIMDNYFDDDELEEA